MLAKLQQKIETYHIRPQNNYNFDEKGFLIGICHALKRIMTLHQRKTKIKYLEQVKMLIESLYHSLPVSARTVPQFHHA